MIVWYDETLAKLNQMTLMSNDWASKNSARRT